MACNGVTVVTAQMEKMDDAQHIITMLKQWTVGQVSISGNVIRLNISLPVSWGEMPLRVAISSVKGVAHLTIITGAGTWDEGKAIIDEWLGRLKAMKVGVSGTKYESHRHNMRAPLLSYNQRQTQ